MISTMVLLLVLRKLIKNDGCFAIIIAALMLTALVLKFFGPFYSRGDIRAVSSLPMGVLIAMLPKIKGRRNRLTWLFLFLVFAVCFSIVCFPIGDVEWWGIRIPELLLDNILYPALIYFTFCVNFKSKLFSYLGSLSFGIYAFQCPANLLRVLGVKSAAVLFAFILLASVLEDGGKRLLHCRFEQKLNARNF
jgi:hypothetical protein